MILGLQPAGLALLWGIALAGGMVRGLALFPAILPGNWLGAQAFGRVSPQAWRWLTGAVLITAALSAIAKEV